MSLYEMDAVHFVHHLPPDAVVLPMKGVASLKLIVGSTMRVEKFRCCICGNFQPENPLMLVYTANIDISTIRLVLSEVAQDKEWGIATIDIKTAFLNAPMPSDEAPVYVTPPAICVHFGLVKPGTIWRVNKAIYGLRQSPRLWGKERDKQLRLMRITLKN